MQNSSRSQELQILGFAGSLREKSLNQSLLRTVQKLAPRGIIITIHDLWGIPLFNEDVEVKGDSGPVVSFKKAIKQTDALIIASLEYSFSVFEALKNAHL